MILLNSNFLGNSFATLKGGIFLAYFFVKTDIILDTINRANGLLTVESMTLNNKTTDTENELLNGMLKDKYILSYNDIDGSNWQPKMYTDKKGIPQLDWILN